MLKRLLNNLSCHADTWVAEWNKTSTERRRLRYGRIQRVLRRTGERLGTFLLLVVAVAAGVSTLAALAPGQMTEEVADGSSLLTYFGTLWMVQATIVALVYPIVVAFVAVLLRRRATAGLALRIYMLDAAVLPAGTSAIGLVAWMGLQYLAVPYVSEEWVTAAMTGNSAWFVFSALLTAWFLFRTLRFLGDGDRLETFERFAIHVALPRDVRARLMGLILSSAQKHGLVPGPDYLSDERGPKILLYPFGEGLPAASIELGSKRVVADIRLRLLSWAIRLWRRKAGRQEPARSFAGLAPEYPTLVFSLQPGAVVDGQVVVARVRAGPPLGWLARSLMCRSVVLRAPPIRDVSYSTFEILEELASEALELIEQRRYEDAFELVTNLSDLHAKLILVGAFTNDAGLPDNAALLEDPYGFGSRRIHERWLDTYRQLAEAAVTALPMTTTIFERHAYLCSRLIRAVHRERIEILEYLLHISDSLMYRLGLWWANNAEERGLIPHDAVFGVELPMPIGRVYERALQVFVGGWESVALWERQRENADVEAVWQECGRTVRLAVAQADHTVSMMLAAVARGDTAAAVWLADSFLKWWHKHEHTFRHSGAYGFENQLATLSVIGEAWSSVRGLLDAVPLGPEEASAAADLAATVARRYWSDLRLIAILLLLDWSPPSSPKSALALQIAAALVRGRSLKHGSEADNEQLSDPGRAVFQLLRMQLVDEQYASRLDKRVEQGQEQRSPDMVAGRVYSSSGAHDVQSLVVAQTLFLSTITTAPLVTKSVEKLQQIWEGQFLKLERFERLTRNIAQCIEKPAYQSKRSNAIILRELLGLSDQIDASEDWVKTAVRDLAERTVEGRNETLRDAKLSQEALDRLGKEISDYVLGHENHVFPFDVRPELVPELSGGNPRALNVDGVSKAPYTDPPLEEYSNLGESLYNFVAEAIARGAVEEYVLAKRPERLRTDSAQVFLEDIASQAQSLRTQGLSPLLIVPARRVPECARPWRYEVGAKGGVANTDVRGRRNDDPPSLVGYFLDVPAHEAPIEASCYIVPREDFRSLLYKTLANASCIRTSATSDDGTRLRLRFEWVFALKAPPKAPDAPPREKS